MSVTRFISAVLLGLLAFAVPVFAEILERNSDTGSFKIGFREGAPPTSFTSEADETAFQFTVAQELGTAPPLTPTERHAEQDFVPTETCAGCHPAQHQAWLRSHHRHAMEPATDETVLGNFDDSTITHRGLTTRFFRRDGRFIVETEGPDGKRGEFEIVYTFGFEPLQQYLIKMAGGKLQALTISWDTTTKRWFHLYPELDIEPGNTLHWTGAFNNWNFTCAACHSTNLKKSYDRSQDVYSMSWSAINVGCQACHGAGGAHVEWAKGEHAQDSANGGSLGLTNDLRGRESQRQFEICAPCHSRRRAISSDYVHGSPFMDHFVPALLREDLYFSDGQILDEVYVYGSYQQSRKFRAGVQCSDCHEPHSGALRADGNMICTQCHSEQPPKTFPTIKPLAYDSPAHHFHKPDGPGAKCVECHMTARTYMIVDPRRDHSFRVPRPDLSVRIGTPNACTQCHRDRNDKWASAKVVEWYGANRRSGPHYGDAIQAGRIGAPGAAIMLVAVAADRGEADIVRATAVSLLGRYLDQETLPAVLEGLIDESPLVRTTTLQALEPLPAETKLQVAAPLLDDPVRAVRIEAARLLAVVPAQAMSPDMRQDFASASAEYVAAQMTMGERAEAHHNLGLFHEAARRWVEAETAYRQAIAIDPHFVPAYVNLAELARDKGDTASEELLLRQAVDAVPDNASANFAVGLFEVRRKRYAAALGYLNRAATLGPESARFSYVYAVALETTGQRMKALSILETAQRRHPWDRDVLFALASYLAVAGDRERALDYVGKLIEADPRDQRARELEFRLTNSRE